MLGLVSRDHGSKEIARELGLSDETVKNHIKAAMAKLGTTSRYDAARLVRLHEGHDPRVAIDPARVIAVSPRPATPAVGRQGQAPGRTGMMVREPRATFDDALDPAGPSEPAPPPQEGGRHGLTTVQILGWIAVTTAALAVAGIAAAPLARSVQDIANMIEEPTIPS